MQHDSNILKLRWAMSDHAHEVRSVKFDLSDMTGEDKLGFQRSTQPYRHYEKTLDPNDQHPGSFYSNLINSTRTVKPEFIFDDVHGKESVKKKLNRYNFSQI